MEQTKIISGNNEEVVWQQITADLKDDSILEYHVIIRQEERTVLLDIDIDPGGGFESGYEFTRLTSRILEKNDFRFALHHEDFMDKMGKLMGMEDVIIGYPEFDDKLIIKTNDPSKVKTVFSDKAVRELFQSLTDFTIHIHHHVIDNEKGKEPFLELEIQRGVTNPIELRKIYHAFFSTLVALDKTAY
jgi:hypothetical protein